MTEQLVIYPTFGQRLTSWRINRNSGTYDIKLMNSTDNDSIFLYIQSHDNNITPIEYYHVNTRDIFSVGMPVTISEDIEEYQKIITGHISKINNDSIDITTNKHNGSKTYRIKNYNILSAHGTSNPDNIIKVNITNKNYDDILKLSYLFGNIGWNAHYKIILANNGIKTFMLSATINNQNIEELKGHVTLVAGSISRPQQNYQPRALMMVSETKMSQSISSDHGNFEEYYRYNIGERALCDKTTVDLVTCSNVESQKYYSHDVTSHNQVFYGYKFKAPTFLPTGKIYMYSEVENNLVYSGTSQLTEYREGDDIDLMVNKTTQVQAKTNISVTGKKVITSGEDDNNKDQTYQKDITIDSMIKNKTDEEVLFILRYEIGNDKLNSTDTEITRRGNGYLEWDIPLHNTEHRISINLSVTSAV